VPPLFHDKPPFWEYATGIKSLYQICASIASGLLGDAGYSLVPQTQESATVKRRTFRPHHISRHQEDVESSLSDSFGRLMEKREPEDQHIAVQHKERAKRCAADGEIEKPK
jgi:hypothetical protein